MDSQSLENEYNFSMAGKYWSNEEDSKLLKYYNEEQMNVVQIAKIFHRFPRGIASRLVHLKVVNCTLDCRGYIQDPHEDRLYYEQIKKFLSQKREERKERKEEKRKEKIESNEKYKNFINVNIPSSDNLQKEIEIIKKDITHMKNTLDNILLILQNVHNIEIVEEEV